MNMFFELILAGSFLLLCSLLFIIEVGFRSGIRLGSRLGLCIGFSSLFPSWWCPVSSHPVLF